jgi:electron-transferring-flavoprotein dehydrogenase
MAWALATVSCPRAGHGPRESMEYDVVVVGAGPAGLATAIRLKQLNAELSVVVLEKGSEPGAHILSGAVMDPRALNELLLPDWKERGAPLNQPVTGDEVLPEARRAATAPMADPRLPAQRRQLRHQPGRRGPSGWPSRPKALGVEIFPGFAAAEVLYSDAAPCAAWPPATWASARTASRTTASSSAWNCWASTPCLPKARAATWASS